MKLFVDFKKPVPIYKEIDFNAESDQIPFNLPKAKRGRGGGTNFNYLKCENFEIIPHAHVTHLETKSHLYGNNLVEPLPLSLNEPLLTKIIDINQISDEITNENENVQFIILKKRITKKRNFEGVNIEIIKQILEKYPKIIVLGINEPSFDPEQDDCLMSAHKFLFNYKEIYLIELLNLEEIKSSNFYYYCFLNLFRLGLTDAYPCSPVLYPIPPRDNGLE